MEKSNNPQEHPPALGSCVPSRTADLPTLGLGSQSLETDVFLRHRIVH